MVVVSVVAIPLSLLTAVLGVRLLGGTLNTMVLGGLAIAVGGVVDDAIIDVENAWRRLRTAGPGVPPLDIIRAASIEVRSSIVHATVAVALVFLPVLFLGGLEGAIFRPLLGFPFNWGMFIFLLQQFVAFVVLSVFFLMLLGLGLTSEALGWRWV